MKLLRAHLSASVTAVLSVVLLARGSMAGVAAAQPGGGTARAGVPWGRVGAGWVLTQYTSARPGEGGGPGPAALYLISPGGTRYQLASWPNWRTAPQLVAWSPDGKRALFQVFTGKGGVELLTLATGRARTFALPGEATPIRFTTPDGLNIVAGRPSGSGTSLARYSLSGGLTRPLGFPADGQVLYLPSGIEFVPGHRSGREVASNRRSPVRRPAARRTGGHAAN